MARMALAIWSTSALYSPKASVVLSSFTCEVKLPGSFRAGPGALVAFAEPDP